MLRLAGFAIRTDTWLKSLRFRPAAFLALMASTIAKTCFDGLGFCLGFAFFVGIDVSLPAMGFRLPYTVTA